MPSHAPALAARCRLLRSLFLAAVAATALDAALAAPSDETDPIARLVSSATAVIAPAATHPADGDVDNAASTQPGLLRQVHDRAADMAVSAMDFLGVHYRRGGQSAETGFDCSGFTRHMYELTGLDLPRRAEEQARAKGLVPVSRADLKPGDLVFFNTMKRTFSHVGIYIGENRFIHAPSRGKTVRTDDLDFAYWAKRFTGARRAEPAGEAVGAGQASLAVDTAATPAAPAAATLP